MTIYDIEKKIRPYKITAFTISGDGREPWWDLTIETPPLSYWNGNTGILQCHFAEELLDDNMKFLVDAYFLEALKERSTEALSSFRTDTKGV